MFMNKSFRTWGFPRAKLKITKEGEDVNKTIKYPFSDRKTIEIPRHSVWACYKACGKCGSPHFTSMTTLH